jgi:hypothetical protein
LHFFSFFIFLRRVSFSYFPSFFSGIIFYPLPYLFLPTCRWQAKYSLRA